MKFKQGQKVGLLNLFGKVSSVTVTIVWYFPLIREYEVQFDTHNGLIQRYPEEWIVAISEPNDILKELL